MKKINLAILKKTSIYITITIVVIITWIQFDSIVKFNNNNPSNKPAFVKQNNEKDPPTWLIQTFENEPVLKQPSIFPPHMTFSKGSYPPVTAIINRIDDSDEGIIQAVHHLIKYPFFKEIYIYNQVKNRPLRAKLLYPKSANSSYLNDINIQVIENINSVSSSLTGKFAACAIASYEKCYFQDDLWLNPYLDSLYTHSCRYSEHFIVNTRLVNYVDYMTWRFKNKDISLHAGYADLRYGGFIPQSKVQNFLIQLNNSTEQKIFFQSLSTRSMEVYFSIWLNQYPYLIFNPLLSLGRDSFKNIDTVNNRLSTVYYMYDAISTLESSLQNNSLFDYFERTELSPSTEERDVRSSCANDRCLFITNIDTMPSIANEDYPQFNSELTTNTSQYEIFFQNQFNNSIPNKAIYAHRSYHKAVDQDTETCWNSVHYPKEGDYFGLYMTGDIRAKRVILYTPTTDFEEEFESLDELFRVSIQFVPFGSWTDCELKSTPFTQLSYRIGFDFECLNQSNNRSPFKSIRIHFKRDLNRAFELCGIGLDNFVV